MKVFGKIYIGLFVFFTVFGAYALDLPVKEINGREYYYYAVENGESLLSIARDLGVSRDDIVKYNPRAADGVRQGTTIYLPVSEFASINFEEEDTEQDIIAEDTTESRRVTIALMQALMLNDTTENKTSRNATEFVRGFMLGVNYYKDNGIEADIYVYDTENSPEVVAETMGNVTMDYVDVVVAPNDAESLHVIADEFRSPDGYILNMFAVQDSTHYTNPRVIQGNTHNTVLYEKATDAIIENFAGYTPVFLISKNGRNEKVNFTNYVRERYAEAGLPTIEMSFNNMLSSKGFEQLDSTENYVFIPLSGSLNEFNKFARALRTFRDNHFDPSSIALFGYPDWTTFRNEALENLYNIEATIYSRFFDDMNDEETYTFRELYEYYYGCEMPEQVPSQALMGIDAALYIFDNLSKNESLFIPQQSDGFRGIQSSMNLDGNNDNMAGLANQAVYIITFRQNKQAYVEVR